MYITEQMRIVTVPGAGGNQWALTGEVHEWTFWSDGNVRQLDRGVGYTGGNISPDFPGGPVVKKPSCNAGDASSIPGQGNQDPTFHGATKPVRHNYWACTLEPASHNYWARVPQLLKPTRLESMLRNKRSHHHEKSPQWEASALQWRVALAHRN